MQDVSLEYIWDFMSKMINKTNLRLPYGSYTERGYVSLYAWYVLPKKSGYLLFEILNLHEIWTNFYASCPSGVKVILLQLRIKHAEKLRNHKLWISCCNFEESDFFSSVCLKAYERGTKQYYIRMLCFFLLRNKVA